MVTTIGPTTANFPLKAEKFPENCRTNFPPHKITLLRVIPTFTLRSSSIKQTESMKRSKGACEGPLLFLFALWGFLIHEVANHGKVLTSSSALCIYIPPLGKRKTKLIFWWISSNKDCAKALLRTGQMHPWFQRVCSIIGKWEGWTERN